MLAELRPSAERCVFAIDLADVRVLRDPRLLCAAYPSALFAGTDEPCLLRQSFGWLLPPAQAVPAGHAVQSSALVTSTPSAKVPGAQAMGVLNVLPRGQSKPASHTLHDVLPASSW